MTGDAMSQPIAFSRPEINADDIAAVTAVLESGWITTGSQSRDFEAELAEYLGVPHVVAVSSCTTAEEICLAYLDLPAGSRVGVPTWTFASTALAVERHSLLPVLLDVDSDTLNLGGAQLEPEIEQLDAVVGVHFAGTPMEAEVRNLCAAHNVAFIEDAAHALGTVDDRGFVAGQQTAGACFSFYATKNLPTGEGGAIATDDPDLAAFAATYRLHGMSRDAIDRYRKPGAHSYDVSLPGIKANFPDILAALGRTQLARFPENQCYRRGLVTRYRETLAGADVRILPAEQHEGSADHLFVIDLLAPERRDAAIAHLGSLNIGTSVHFRPLHTFSWFADNDVEVARGGLPVADKLDGRIMSLPLHVNMTLDDVTRVSESLLEAI